jgi:hypothetical protein
MIFNPDVYKKNMQALEVKYPELAERVKTCKIVSYELVQMEGCMPNLRHNLVGKFWYDGRLDEYLSRQWKDLKHEGTKVPIFLGFGLGFEPMYYLSKYGESNMIQPVVKRDWNVFRRERQHIAQMEPVDLPEASVDGNPVRVIQVWLPKLLLYGPKVSAIVEQPLPPRLGHNKTPVIRKLRDEVLAAGMNDKPGSAIAVEPFGIFI